MRRGLSPLVATIILIAFTILGGVLVYEFFTRTSETLMVSGEKLLVTAATSYFSNTQLLVRLEITNGYRTNITITKFQYITASSTSPTPTQVNPIYSSGQSNLVPSAKYTATLLVPVNTKAILIEYKVRDQTLVETVPIG